MFKAPKVGYHSGSPVFYTICRCKAWLAEDDDDLLPLTGVVVVPECLPHVQSERQLEAPLVTRHGRLDWKKCSELAAGIIEQEPVRPDAAAGSWRMIQVKYPTSR